VPSITMAEGVKLAGSIEPAKRVAMPRAKTITKERKVRFIAYELRTNKTLL
jgi:hypothetical protein